MRPAIAANLIKQAKAPIEDDVAEAVTENISAEALTAALSEMREASERFEEIEIDTSDLEAK